MSNTRTLAIEALNDALRMREQTLIDLLFEVTMRAEQFAGMDNEKRAEAIRYHLGVAGFADAKPQGLSWAYLAKQHQVTL